MRYFAFASLSVLVSACAPLQTAEELRANPFGTHTFASEKSPQETAALIETWMAKCYGAATYSSTGMQTSWTDFDRDDRAGLITLSAGRDGALGSQAWYSVDVRPDQGGGSTVAVHYPAKPYERNARLLPELWVNSAYKQCEAPKE